MVTSASNVKACLNGSQFLMTSGSRCRGKKVGGGGAPPLGAMAVVEVNAETLRAMRYVPQYHGPALEAVLEACKMMELEVNFSEAALDVTLDNTVVCIALVLCLNRDITLLDRARDRFRMYPSSGGAGEEGFVKGGVNLPRGRYWTYLP